MWKRTVFTTITPLPPGVSRAVVIETLKSHTEMINLNPLVIESHPIKPPANATPEEYHCAWYSLTDRVQYLPGGLASGQVTYTCCFHDLKDGLQTHCYAPLGLEIKGKWTLGGSLPGEPIAPVELGVGAPLHGLWLREDVDMRCNILLGGFVKKTLQKAHAALVGRLVMKSQTQEAAAASASTEYSPSDRDSQGLAEGASVSQETTPAGPQSLPLQNTASSRSDQPDSRNSDSRSPPAALHPRISRGAQKGSYPYPDPAAGGQHPSNRVSRQNSGSPSSHQVEAADPSRDPYRASPPRQQDEMPTQQTAAGRQARTDGQSQGQGQGQAQNYQNRFVAELE